MTCPNCTNPATHEHKGKMYCYPHFVAKRQHLHQPAVERAKQVANYIDDLHRGAIYQPEPGLANAGPDVRTQV